MSSNLRSLTSDGNCCFHIVMNVNIMYIWTKQYCDNKGTYGTYDSIVPHVHTLSLRSGGCCLLHIKVVIHVFFFISNSIFQLSLELLNTVFNIAENLRGPLLQIGVQTSFQSEFFHLAKENFENTVNFSTFC